MIKRYYSSYTGKQIDEAVRAIVENQVTLEDLSPELVAEIKSWISGGSYENIILLGYFYNDKFSISTVVDCDLKITDSENTTKEFVFNKLICRFLNFIDKA